MNKGEKGDLGQGLARDLRMESRKRQIRETKEQREMLDHRKAIEAIATILKMDAGRKTFEYLLKHISPVQLPELGLEGALMHDRMGFCRAGRSIYDLAVQADFKIAAEIMAKVEKEKLDEIAYEDSQLSV